MPQKIYFHGAGLVTAIGNNVAENLQSIENHTFQPSQIRLKQEVNNLSIPYFTINNPAIEQGESRLYSIIDNIIDQALVSSNLTNKQLKKAGLFMGSTSFDMFVCESALATSTPTDENISRCIPAFTRLSSYIQKRFNIEGPVYTFNSACTSSANALMYAAEFIRSGDIEHALVLGLEFYNQITALGFSGLELISKKGMRPFEKERDGLHLGEGCGAIIISAQPAEHGFAYIAGANLGDNFSITACNPDGSTVKAVIERALSQAKLDARDIKLIKTHGTASLSNDEAESAGLRQIFNDAVAPIITLKPFIGHTLGACGINELIVFYSSLINKKLVTFPSRISDEFNLTLATDSDLPEKGNYLLNYFAFGGNSTALIIGND